MSRQIQIRRGTAAEHSSFTGAIGEITMDTTNNTLRVHDGTTVGGVPLAKQSEVPDLTNIDYVIESQSPTAGNNYTWYRKYRSGWVEQGGIISTTSSWGIATATLPVEMADANYSIDVTDIRQSTETSAFTDNGAAYVRHVTRASVISRTSTSFKHQSHDTISWRVSGMAAA